MLWFFVLFFNLACRLMTEVYDGAGPDAYFWVGNGTQPNIMGKLSTEN
jgi:hypothetical protein